MKTSDIFGKNLVNKKLLLAAFYHSTYQHDSKDFNICNYIPVTALRTHFDALLFLDPAPALRALPLILEGQQVCRHHHSTVAQTTEQSVLSRGGWEMVLVGKQPPNVTHTALSWWGGGDTELYILTKEICPIYFSV